MIKHCYIHIPFCKTICSYCDFCKQFYDSQKVKEYLKNLREEIERDYQGEEMDTIYIGGGTPTCLSLEELKELMDILSLIHKSHNTEITIEGNVETISKEKLVLFKQYGINRISLGIESINENHLRFLERNHTKEQIQKTIQMIRKEGFHNLNLDLIYAIPGETIEEVQEDLDFLLSLQPEHISTYSLMIEDHTKLKIQGVKPIAEETDEEMYSLITSYLKEKGYIHYEISNFSKKGYESKHNIGYWKNEEYYGFGCGASSYKDSIRKTNTRSLTNYPKGNLLEREEVTESDKIEYEILLNLRLLEGISLSDFEEKYQMPLKDLYNYQQLVEQGLLIEEENHLRVPEEKIYVSNEIIVKLLQSKKEI
ncbi:MAG: radical SAM family heme chaperone HemW [Bacilli bacterium]|nr:radical SAM family heme chaperone HemW [Bacilli bacterium]